MTQRQRSGTWGIGPARLCGLATARGRPLRAGRCGGVVMVTVMVIMAIASIAAASLLYRMNAEVSAAGAARQGDQAAAAAYSGLEKAMDVLAHHLHEPDLWLNNPALFRDQLVSEDGQESWYFTIYLPPGFASELAMMQGTDMASMGQFSDLAPPMLHGLADTAARINVNTADRQTLLALPGMTDDLVDALLLYRDGVLPDDEADALLGSAGPGDDMPVKGAALASIEELLLVPGFTAELVLGEPGGRREGHGVIAQFSFDDMTPVPLAELLTVHATEPDRDSRGLPRVDLNRDVEELAELDEELEELGLSGLTRQVIRLYRFEGNLFEHPSDLAGMRYQLQRDPPGARRGGGGGRNAPGRGGRGGRGGGPGGGGQDFRGLRSQLGSPTGQAERIATVPVALFAEDEARPPGLPAVDERAMRAGDWIETRLDGYELALLLESTTASGRARQQSLSGRVNIHTASPTVLQAALPGADAELIERILSVRSELEPSERRTTAWLFGRGVMDGEQYRALAPRLTAQGRQFHLRVVGYGLPSGRYRVFEAVVDASERRPRLVYLRDLTRMGLPMPIQPQPTR